MKNKKLKITLIVTVCLVLVLAIGCTVYISDYYHATEPAAAAMAIDTSVEVLTRDNQVLFVPDEPLAGLIFYPGGKVEYTAYAPLMRALAEEGILCILVEMPGNLAVLDMDAADGLQDLYPEVESWYLGGHSLGGSMAASYAAEHAEDYEGLLLLAAYSTADLTESGLEVVSIYGSEDKVQNMEKYEECRGNLPTDTTEQVIQGGCHAGFGSYGPQDGDGTPTISMEVQIAAAVDLFMSVIK